MHLLHANAPVNSKISFVFAHPNWNERAVSLSELSENVSSLNGTPDIFMSQQSFWGWRRISQLNNLGACYVDIDYHNSKKWSRFSSEVMTSVLVEYIDQENLPRPSYIVSTGRGLLIVWLLCKTSRNALPRWNSVQKHLYDSFTKFGADPRALDAARVFRLIGSENSKSGSRVRPTWLSSADFTKIERWDFDNLADEILPFTRNELRILRSTCEANKKQNKSISRPKHKLTVATLWETRLSDLQKLRRLRGGALPEGNRDEWLFLTTIAMSWIVPSFVLEREAYALAIECAKWSKSETKSRMSAVFKRAKQAANGSQIEFNNRSFDPRYYLRDETIIRRLNISENEMRSANLRCLVTDEIKRERKRDYMREQRGYDENQRNKSIELFEVHKLRVAGFTQAEIAREVGISQQKVSRLLKKKI